MEMKEWKFVLNEIQPEDLSTKEKDISNPSSFFFLKKHKEDSSP